MNHLQFAEARDQFADICARRLQALDAEIACAIGARLTALKRERAGVAAAGHAADATDASTGVDLAAVWG